MRNSVCVLLLRNKKPPLDQELKVILSAGANMEVTPSVDANAPSTWSQVGRLRETICRLRWIWFGLGWRRWIWFGLGFEHGHCVAFSSVLARAINVCGDILCSSAEHAGDDHRLGAYEAPSAIISTGVGNEPKEAPESQCCRWISGGLWCEICGAVATQQQARGSQPDGTLLYARGSWEDHVVGSVRRHLQCI